MKRIKRLILTLFVRLLCFVYQARAQWTVIDPSSLTQNIKSAVQSSTTATNMIKSLQESVKTHNQGKAYYDVLKSVHNTIKGARKAKLALEMVSEITEIYTSGFNRMVSDPDFAVDGLAAISTGHARLLGEDSALVMKLEAVVTSGNGFSLSDRERMDVVDQVYTKMSEYHNLTRYYTHEIISVSFIRSRERDDAHRALALYGNPNGRCWQPGNGGSHGFRQFTPDFPEPVSGGDTVMR